MTVASASNNPNLYLSRQYEEVPEPVDILIQYYKEASNPVVEIPNWSIHDETALQLTGAIYLRLAGRDPSEHNLDLSNQAIREIFHQTLEGVYTEKWERIKNHITDLKDLHIHMIFIGLIVPALLVILAVANIFPISGFSILATCVALFFEFLKFKSEVDDWKAWSDFVLGNRANLKDSFFASPRSYFRNMRRYILDLQKTTEPLAFLNDHRGKFDRIAKAMSNYSKMCAELHKEKSEWLKVNAHVYTGLRAKNEINSANAMAGNHDYLFRIEVQKAVVREIDHPNGSYPLLMDPTQVEGTKVLAPDAYDRQLFSGRPRYQEKFHEYFQRKEWSRYKDLDDESVSMACFLLEENYRVYKNFYFSSSKDVTKQRLFTLVENVSRAALRPIAIAGAVQVLPIVLVNLIADYGDHGRLLLANFTFAIPPQELEAGRKQSDEENRKMIEAGEKDEKLSQSIFDKNDKLLPRSSD